MSSSVSVLSRNLYEIVTLICNLMKQVINTSPFIFHNYWKIKNEDCTDIYCILNPEVHSSTAIFKCNTVFENDSLDFDLKLLNSLQWFKYRLIHRIRNIATNVASMFTRTCRLSWRHLDCRDVIKICGQLWSQEQPYMKFWASFPQTYRLQQAKQIRKLTKQIGLACWNRKI